MLEQPVTCRAALAWLRGRVTSTSRLPGLAPRILIEALVSGPPSSARRAHIVPELVRRRSGGVLLPTGDVADAAGGLVLPRPRRQGRRGPAGGAGGTH